MTAPHPAPHAGRVDPRALLAALAAGPAGWIVQLVAGAAVASVACGSRRAAEAASGTAFTAEPTLLVVINLVCLAVVVAGGAFSRIAWNRVAGEKAGGPEAALTIGDGRTRFLAVCGMLSAVAFTCAVLFNTIEPLIVPGCWTGSS